MRIPILIAARNEASWIGRTLDSLPRDGVEPIVIPNGCTDNTAEIAESFGATVLNCPAEGKMQALQAGIRYLGKEAIEPFITLDADARVLFPSRWAGRLLRERARVDNDSSAVAIGPTLYRGKGFGSVVRTARHFYVQHRDHYQNSRGYYCGRNMLIHPVRADVVEGLLALGPLWPGEDRAIKDVIVNHGGNAFKSVNLLAAVASDGTRLPGLGILLGPDGRRNSHTQLIASYLAEAPPGSMPYEPSLRAQLPRQSTAELTYPAKN